MKATEQACILPALLWACLTAAPRAQEPTIEPAVPLDRIAAMDSNKFAFAVLARLGAGNQLLAPHSLREAFAMCLLATEGRTNEEIRQVLQFGAADTAHIGMQELATALAGIAQKGLMLETANRMWGTAEQGFFEPAFLRRMEEVAAGGIDLLSFADAERARASINEWVGKQTGGNIGELLPAGSINPNVTMVLTNAVYLRAQWAAAFDPRFTGPMSFALADGGQVQVPGMNATGAFETGRLQFSDGLGCRAIAIPYVGERLRMVIAVPEGEATVQQLAAALDDHSYERLRAGLQETALRLRLPKWTMQRDYALHEELLPSLGMRAPFAFSSDWAPCNGEDGAELRISGVFHGATIVVDERGTEASGATGIVVQKRGMSQAFPVDRPFVFTIEDRATGLVMFAGQVCDPR